MGLSISTSNVLLGLTPIITEPLTGEIASNISDPDHSLNYTFGPQVGNSWVKYGPQTNISYVAISGHNAATPASVTITLLDGAGDIIIDAVTIKRNHNVMFTFPEMDFTDLKVRFETSPLTYQTTVSFIAAGKYLDIATGEQAGYKRNWLNRSTVQRTTSNLQGAPVSSLTHKKALKGMLSLPNESALFSQDEWQDFIDFAFDQPFFIKEIENKPESTYICFDPNTDVNSHSQTLSLNVLKLGFTVYNGV